MFVWPSYKYVKTLSVTFLKIIWNKRDRKPKGQSIIYNQDTLATFGTNDQGLRQTKRKTQKSDKISNVINIKNRLPYSETVFGISWPQEANQCKHRYIKQSKSLSNKTQKNWMRNIHIPMFNIS